MTPAPQCVTRLNLMNSQNIKVMNESMLKQSDEKLIGDQRL